MLRTNSNAPEPKTIHVFSAANGLEYIDDILDVAQPNSLACKHNHVRFLPTHHLSRHNYHQVPQALHKQEVQALYELLYKKVRILW